jgi:hypothetical protein
MISIKPNDFLNKVSKNRENFPDQAIEEINSSIYSYTVFPTCSGAILGYFLYRFSIKKQIISSRPRRMIIGSISSFLTASLLALAGVPFLEADFKAIDKKYDMRIYPE